MISQETAVTFSCQGKSLLGILHRPVESLSCGVVIVPGAPQYRVGTHRQFVLLARDLAAAGFPVLRFDYRGMGDSDGDFRSFEAVNEDISAAIDCLCGQVPELGGVALWGLCDGASAICFFANCDPRVRDIVLINPWVRTEESLARAQIDTYYTARLFSWDFWRRFFTGEVKILSSALEFLSRFRAARSRTSAGDAGEPGQSAVSDGGSLPQRVGRSLRAFDGRVLLMLSGRDLTAREFEGAVLESREMASWCQRSQVTVKRLESANHTYSKAEWRETVHEWTIAHLMQDTRGARRTSSKAAQDISRT